MSIWKKLVFSLGTKLNKVHTLHNVRTDLQGLYFATSYIYHVNLTNRIMRNCGSLSMTCNKNFMYGYSI